MPFAGRGVPGVECSEPPAANTWGLAALDPSRPTRMRLRLAASPPRRSSRARRRRNVAGTLPRAVGGGGRHAGACLLLSRANFAVSRAKRDFHVFGPVSPNEGAVFSKDFAFSRQAREDFAKRLRARRLFWASGRGLAKLFSAISLGKSALISRDPPPAFCGLPARTPKRRLSVPVEGSATFSMRFMFFGAAFCIARSRPTGLSSGRDCPLARRARSALSGFAAARSPRRGSRRLAAICRG